MIAGALATVLAGEAVAYAWIGWVSRPPNRAGDTVSLGNGHVTFRIPAGWRSVACQGNDDDCVNLRTPQGSTDVITVDVFTPSPSPPGAAVVAVAADPSTLPGARSFMVDGVRFVRWHTDAVTTSAPRPATTSAMGSLRDGSRVFVRCAEKAGARPVRSGCAAVLGSLHVGQ